MGTMLGYIDDHRSGILAQIQDAGEAAKIRRELDAHLVRMLTGYNEECSSDILREYAASLVSVSRSALSLIDSDGEIRIWEQKGAGAGAQRRLTGKQRIIFLLLVIAGIALLAAAGAAILSLSSKGYLERLPGAIALPAGGGLLLFLAGRLRGKGGEPGSEGNLKAQLSYDPDKIIRHLREMAMTMDKCLEDFDASVKARERALAGKTGNMLPDEKQLDLYADLLEAGSSRDTDSAMDAIETLRYYLHSQGIETVDRKDGHEDWFEYMPSDQSGTIRPALVRDGLLLKKGLATMAEE